MWYPDTPLRNAQPCASRIPSAFSAYRRWNVRAIVQRSTIAEPIVQRLNNLARQSFNVEPTHARDCSTLNSPRNGGLVAMTPHPPALRDSGNIFATLCATGRIIFEKFNAATSAETNNF